MTELVTYSTDQFDSFTDDWSRNMQSETLVIAFVLLPLQVVWTFDHIATVYL